MPDGFACSQAANWNAVFDHVGNDINLRMALDKAPPCLLDRRPVQRTKTPAERDQILIGQFLPPEQQDQMIDPDSANLFEFTVGYRA